MRLVNVAKVIPEVVLDIRYATNNNFVGVKLYPEARCFLREGTAEKLRKVANQLAENARLGLKIFDGYRPLSVQRWLWATMPDPNYVADPETGSKHNRGAAVDLTLIDLVSGREMEMGTGYDDFSVSSHPGFTHLPATTLCNRAILREAMIEFGFEPNPTEWWHISWGDQMWAWATKAPYAVYGVAEHFR